MPPYTVMVGEPEMLIRADMRTPKPGLELSFHADESLERASDNARLLIIEASANEQRNGSWIVDKTVPRPTFQR